MKNPFTKASATVVASIFGMGKISRYLVKQSTATRAYLFPLGLSGNGPTMSIVTLSMGLPTTCGFNGARLVVVVPLCMAHVLHAAT